MLDTLRRFQWDTRNNPRVAFWWNAASSVLAIYLFMAIVLSVASCSGVLPLDTPNKRYLAAETYFGNAEQTILAHVQAGTLKGANAAYVATALQTGRDALDAWHADLSNPQKEQAWVIALQTLQRVLSAIEAKGAG